MSDALHRLDSVARDLRAQLEGLDDGELRRIAHAVAHRAVSGTRLEEKSVDGALGAMGKPGQRIAREVVREAVQRLDEAAWDMVDESEAGGASEAGHAAAFARARAAAAVEWALDDNPLTAALESVYEAHAAGVPLDDLRAALDRR